MGGLANALAAAARGAGVTMRAEAEVRRTTSRNGRVTGVDLANGERIEAPTVASNADPKRTFLHLVDPEELSPEFLVRVRNFQTTGVVAKVNFALDHLPKFPVVGDGMPAHFRISPSLAYLERAYDDAKYGHAYRAHFLEAFFRSILDPDLAPSGKHVLSCLVPSAPSHLTSGNWDKAREQLGDT